MEKSLQNLFCCDVCMPSVWLTTALFATPDVKKLIKEITTMLSFDHPNVMSLIGVSLDRESPLLIMPFMINGSVLDYVKHHKEELLHTSEAAEAQVGHNVIINCCISVLVLATEGDHRLWSKHFAK